MPWQAPRPPVIKETSAVSFDAKLPGNCFVFSHHAKDIFTHDLSNVGIRIPEIDHSFYQRGVVRDILHSFWDHSGYTVEIRPDSQVVRADQLHGVIDVAQYCSHTDLRTLRAVALLA